VTYALILGQRNCGITLGDAEQVNLTRTTGREAYKRAMERSHEGGSLSKLKPDRPHLAFNNDKADVAARISETSAAPNLSRNWSACIQGWIL
tara:strand:+ start:347 stop:622 length:276 start_codon:yes stop_codon:yes gene_type:complete